MSTILQVIELIASLTGMAKPDIFNHLQLSVVAPGSPAAGQPTT